MSKKNISIELEEELYNDFVRICLRARLKPENVLYNFVSYTRNNDFLEPEVLSPNVDTSDEAFQRTIKEMQEKSLEKYPNGMPLDEINRIIKEVRDESRQREEEGNA